MRAALKVVFVEYEILKFMDKWVLFNTKSTLWTIRGVNQHNSGKSKLYGPISLKLNKHESSLNPSEILKYKKCTLI